MNSNQHLHHLYWKVELEGDTSFTETQLPDIITHWQQQKLVFLAQGKAPYLLAYGNRDIEKAHTNGISQLMQTLKDSGEQPDQVTMGDPVVNQHVTTRTKPIPWKLIAFWILLLLGTAVLGYMAYSLYRQMNQD